jgi:hypothetical protein
MGQNKKQRISNEEITQSINYGLNKKNINLSLLDEEIEERGIDESIKFALRIKFARLSLDEFEKKL